jgi:hypothetical protein
MSARVLKSRAALYAASPAYRPDDVTTITGMGQFTVSDDASYAENWERAALMSDTIIRTAGFGNFSALTQANLISTGNTPADFVFRFYFNANGIETRHFPPYYYGEAQTTPSHNLVEAFPSKTGGFPTTDSRSLYDPADPYAMARDNRFALNIYYHGRTFATNSGAIDVSYGGKDSPSYSPNATRTGYYLSKFLSKKDGMLTPTPDKSNDGHYTPVMRKSEVFYNFAEASNEAWGPTVKGPGCQYSAYEVMKTIRAAYGIAPDTWLEECAADKDMFRELVQSERRLEFAFEGQRFFDMRRWLLELDEPVRGVQVTNDNGAYSYRVVEVERHRYGQVHHYYLPLPYQELMKNPNLKNNAGWDNN